MYIPLYIPLHTPLHMGATMNNRIRNMVTAFPKGCRLPPDGPIPRAARPPDCPDPPFLTETFAKLPPGFRLYALRADTGCFVTELLEDLEARRLPDAIAVRMNRLVHRQIVGLTAWRPFGPGLEVAETQYQALNWPAPRRLVVVRELIQERPEARGRRLFEVPGYTFHAVVTTLPLPPEDVWRFYNSHADSENRLKELKEDFGARGFSLQAFDGTEAAFRLIGCLFNLVALFKRDVTRNERPPLSTLAPGSW